MQAVCAVGLRVRGEHRERAHELSHVRDTVRAGPRFWRKDEAQRVDLDGRGYEARRSRGVCRTGQQRGEEEDADVLDPRGDGAVGGTVQGLVV